MNLDQQNNFTGTGGSYPMQAEGVASVRAFLSSVFSYMATGLVISGIMAWWFGTNAELFAYLRHIDFASGTMKPTMLGWIVMFAPLGMVLLMGGMIERLSSTALLVAFMAFSTVMGISISYIFVLYTSAVISNVFFLAAVVFGIMAVAGYTTKTDLTKLGSILMIGLIGIIIASLVNFLIGSSTMSYVISLIGVVIFTGLTAYDMQRLKVMGEQVAAGTETAQKMAIMGALHLYLDFINLFLLLLRLFGRRD
jgi:uncharacterized protein